jgi:hypothetical protein
MTYSILPPPIEDAEPPHQSNTTKRINKVVVVALVATALAILLMLKWAVASEQVLTVNKQPFPTRTIREHPTAGGVVFLTADFCKNEDVKGELRTSFVSETREVFLPISREMSEKGCRTVELPVLIPKDIEPDTYRIKMRITYDINPLKQNVVQEFYSYPVIIDPTTATNGLPVGVLEASKVPPAAEEQ